MLLFLLFLFLCIGVRHRSGAAMVLARFLLLRLFETKGSRSGGMTASESCG